MDTDKLLQEIAEHTLEEKFIAEYVTDDKDEMLLEALGCALSQFADWDGVVLMKILASALEDANFHTECKQIREMIGSY